MNKDNLLSPSEFLNQLQEDRLEEHNQIASDMCDILTASLLSSLPSDYRRKLETIPVGVLLTKNVNAVTIKIQSGHIIVIDYSLISFLFTLNKILLCRIASFGLEPTISIKEAAEKAFEVTNYFFSVSEIDKKIPRLIVPPKNTIIASILSNNQTIFVIGHELAHILLSHFDIPEKFEMIKDDNLKSNIYSFEKSHELEYDSDERSAEMVFEYYNKNYDPFWGGSEPTYAQAGVDIFFTYVDFIHDILKIPKSYTHPDPIDRRNALRKKYWHKLPEISKKLSEEAENIFSILKSELK